MTESNLHRLLKEIAYYNLRMDGFKEDEIFSEYKIPGGKKRNLAQSL